MKNLENYKVVEMTHVEGLEVDGGSDPDGCSGCAAGRAVREFFSNFFSGMSSLSSGGYAGMGYY